jgi:nucleoside-diphosphate-sugar epimerase
MDKLIIGCGYLGRRVAALWQGQGHRVFATTRSAARAEELRALGLEPVICDVLDPASLRSLPAVGTVLYCVGLDRAAGKPMRQVYLDGLANVLSVLPPPRRFLSVSSTSVYGQDQGEEVDETALTAPADESGKVVLEAERLLHARHADAILLRFAGIYGPGRLLRRQAIEAGEPIIGDAEKWLNLIHVADGAAAIVAAQERGQPGGIYNICDDHPVRRSEFYVLLAQLLDAPAPRFVMPAAGATPPPYERANRRIVNRQMHEVLQLTLRYPSYAEGLQAAIETERATSPPSARPRPGE